MSDRGLGVVCVWMKIDRRVIRAPVASSPSASTPARRPRNAGVAREDDAWPSAGRPGGDAKAAVPRAAGIIAVHDEIPRRHDETWAPGPEGGARAALAERVAAASARTARRVNISHSETRGRRPIRVRFGVRAGTRRAPSRRVYSTLSPGARAKFTPSMHDRLSRRCKRRAAAAAVLPPSRAPTSTMSAPGPDREGPAEMGADAQYLEAGEDDDMHEPCVPRGRARRGGGGSGRGG